MDGVCEEHHNACATHDEERDDCYGGCKHSKVDQESAPVYESHDFLGQTPISSSKMLFNFFFHDALFC